VNVYVNGQFEHGRPTALLDLHDPRRKPLRAQLLEAYQRYGRPLIIGETSCWSDLRVSWLRYVVDEAVAAMQQGVDLQGICLYPIIDMPEWHSGRFEGWGLWDLVPSNGHLERVLAPDYHAEFVRAQQRVARVLDSAGETSRPA
jgi:hypothetical protein